MNDAGDTGMSPAFFVQTGLQNLQDCYTVVIQDMIESYQRKMPSWFFHGAK